MNELSRETRELLERGRDGVPLSGEHRARLKGVLFAQIAAASLPATATTAAAWSSVLAKVVGVATVVGLGTAAGVIGWRTTHPPAQRSQPLVASEAHMGGSPSPVSIASSVPSAGAKVSEGQIAPRLPDPTVAPADARRRDGAHVTTSEPLARPVSPQAGVESNAAAAPAAASIGSTESLAEEARLLRKADLALKAGEANEALRILEQLGARLPNGSLGPERRAERIFALCQAARISEARAEASAFLGVYPTGPLAARVRASCGAAAP